jgi:hypothetical protein
MVERWYRRVGLIDNAAAITGGSDNRPLRLFVAAEDRVRSLLLPALDALEEELATGANRGTLALALLRLAGLDGTRKVGTLDLSRAGPTDPETIIDLRAREKRGNTLIESLQQSLDGPPATATERTTVLKELDALFASLERPN